VSEIGELVKGFKTGDRISIEANPYACGQCLYCWKGQENLCLQRRGPGYEVDGGFAEYVKVPADMLIPLPENVSLEEGAAMDVCVATHAVMDRSKVKPGDCVVIIGPGFEGLCVLQLVKLHGAGYTIVTGLEKDAERLNLAEKLGADRVMVTEKEDLKEEVAAVTRGVGVDVVFEASGSEAGINQAIDIIRRNGIITMIGMLPEKTRANLFSVVARQVSLYGTRSYTRTNCEWVMKALSQGKIQLKPLITHKALLEEWKKIFDLLIERKGVKPVLIP